MADFEYLLWTARYEDTLISALTVYETRASTQAIIQSTEEALKAFDEHRSKEKLSYQLLQITLENRLSKFYLNDLYFSDR